MLKLFTFSIVKIIMLSLRDAQRIIPFIYERMQNIQLRMIYSLRINLEYSLILFKSYVHICIVSQTQKTKKFSDNLLRSSCYPQDEPGSKQVQFLRVPCTGPLHWLYQTMKNSRTLPSQIYVRSKYPEKLLTLDSKRKKAGQFWHFLAAKNPRANFLAILCLLSCSGCPKTEELVWWGSLIRESVIAGYTSPMELILLLWITGTNFQGRKE